MNVFFAVLLMSSPFALAALLSWYSHRHGVVPINLLPDLDDRDGYRVGHDADAARTRFEYTPRWPVSGALGERH